MEEKIYDLLVKKDEVTWQTIIYDLIKSEELIHWNVDVSKLENKFR